MNTRTCEQCGEHLRARHSHRARFCSTRCRVAAHRTRTAVPVELRGRERWVRRSADKVPLTAGTGRPASSTDPATWASHTDAVRSPHGAGLGYVLADGDDVVVLDLDHCLDGEQLAPWAAEILAACPPTYTEVSLSGTGLHIWGRGRLARGRRIRRPDGAAIEAYSSGRYIALGHRYHQAPLQLADLTEVLDSLT
ncbi:DNA primase [Streptomyces sp. MNU76]|uniref:DNA primase n=1 Tax=Streptomyces sp. MNU76 TaxID=2560026 RepID=UPI001E49763F|nr:DNA primase [Streptomyces sp. MNU76]MCC9712062.1 DNA primase [Streptomyces sp. MNU76]